MSEHYAETKEWEKKKNNRKKGEYTHNRALTALGERPLVILQNKEQDQ